MADRILVTAANGNVGREVARACASASASDGFDVRVADRNLTRLRERFPECSHARLDFTDRTTWPDALADRDAVFLLRPPAIADMEATLNPFIDQAYRAGVKHIVFLSVAGADTMKWVPHRKVELHLEARRDRAWTVLRPGFFAQNLQDAYQKDITEDDRLYVPAGDGRIAFLDVRDVGEVTAMVLRDPARFRGEALTLTGPAAIGFDEVARVLTEVIGRRIRYEPASVLGYIRHLRRRGLPWMQITVQVILHLGLRRGDAERVDPTLARLLGRSPRTMREYITDAAGTWRKGEGS